MNGPVLPDDARRAPRGMRTQTLRFAVAAARQGSISRAASLFNASQPTVSQAIADLERRCGTALFHRDGRGVRATAEGEAMLRAAEEVLADLDRLDAEMAALSPDRSVDVTIGMPPSVSGVLGPALVAELREVLPQVRLRLAEGYSGTIQRGLLDGAYDLGILYASQSVAGMNAERVLTERLVLVGAPGEASPGRFEVPFWRLADLPLVLPSRSHGLRQLIEREARRAGVRLDVVLEIDAMTAAMEVCRAGGVHTILPSCAVGADERRGLVRALPVVDPDLTRDISLATTTARPLTHAARTAARVAVETARRLVSEGRWLATL